MPNQDEMKRIIRITSKCSSACDHCNEGIHRRVDDFGDISIPVNHYLAKHNYTIMHIGTETEKDDDDKLLYYTVAILGSPNPPTVLPETSIEELLS